MASWWVWTNLTVCWTFCTEVGWALEIFGSAIYAFCCRSAEVAVCRAWVAKTCCVAYDRPGETFETSNAVHAGTDRGVAVCRTGAGFSCCSQIVPVDWGQACLKVDTGCAGDRAGSAHLILQPIPICTSRASLFIRTYLLYLLFLRFYHFSLKIDQNFL